SDAQGTHLDADLGRLTAPLQVRWRQEDGQSQSAQVKVREAYLWDLRADASNLTALLHYTVSQGSIVTVTLALPEGVEVESVEAVTRPDGAPLRLKDWHLPRRAGRRFLEVEFVRPITGAFQLTLVLPSARTFPGSADLVLPVPEGAEPVERLLAYSVE